MKVVRVPPDAPRSGSPCPRLRSRPTIIEDYREPVRERNALEPELADDASRAEHGRDRSGCTYQSSDRRAASGLRGHRPLARGRRRRRRLRGGHRGSCDRRHRGRRLRLSADGLLLPCEQLVGGGRSACCSAAWLGHHRRLADRGRWAGIAPGLHGAARCRHARRPGRAPGGAHGQQHDRRARHHRQPGPGASGHERCRRQRAPGLESRARAGARRRRGCQRHPLHAPELLRGHLGRLGRAGRQPRRRADGCDDAAGRHLVAALGRCE